GTSATSVRSARTRDMAVGYHRAAVRSIRPSRVDGADPRRCRIACARSRHVGGAMTCVASDGLAIGPLLTVPVPVTEPVGVRGRGASFQVLRYRYMNTTEIADSTGTASSAPTRP